MIYNSVYFALADIYELIIDYIKVDNYITLYVSADLYEELSFLNIDSRINIILDKNIKNRYEFKLTESDKLIKDVETFFEND